MNYELERLGGVTFGEDEFQESIKQYIPQGNIFKAFPIQFTHNDPYRIMKKIKSAPVIYSVCLLKYKIAGEIIKSRGDNIYFSLRTKVILYPENVFALWVILAVRYRSV